MSYSESSLFSLRQHLLFRPIPRRPNAWFRPLLPDLLLHQRRLLKKKLIRLLFQKNELTVVSRSAPIEYVFIEHVIQIRFCFNKFLRIDAKMSLDRNVSLCIKITAYMIFIRIYLSKRHLVREHSPLYSSDFKHVIHLYVTFCPHPQANVPFHPYLRPYTSE